jgi:hypothetical protein
MYERIRHLKPRRQVEDKMNEDKCSFGDKRKAVDLIFAGIQMICIYWGCLRTGCLGEYLHTNGMM